MPRRSTRLSTPKGGKAKSPAEKKKKKLTPALLEHYNAVPIYIIEPSVFRQQCADAMEEASSPEEFIKLMDSIREKNLSAATSRLRAELAKRRSSRSRSRSGGVACFASFGSLLAGDEEHEAATGSVDGELQDSALYGPPWADSVFDLLPEKSPCSSLPLEREFSQSAVSSRSSQSGKQNVGVKARSAVAQGSRTKRTLTSDDGDDDSNKRQRMGGPSITGPRPKLPPTFLGNRARLLSEQELHEFNETGLLPRRMGGIWARR